MNHPFLVTGEERHRIDFGDEFWIDIARSVTAMQRARWSKTATTYKTKVIGRGKKATTDSEMDFDNEAFLRAFLGDVVLAWSEPSPVDVTKLSEAAVTRIQEEFDALNPTDADEDERLGESAAP